MAGRILDFGFNLDGDCELIYWDSLNGRDAVIVLDPETTCDFQIGSEGVNRVYLRAAFKSIKSLMDGGDGWSEPT